MAVPALKTLDFVKYDFGISGGFVASSTVNFCVLTFQRETGLCMVKVGGSPVVKLMASLAIGQTSNLKLVAMYIVVAVGTLLC